MAEKKVREMRLSARRVFLDPSSPPVLSVVRVVIITLLILSVWDFAKGIIGALTFLFFMLILAIFFAYLMEPLVKLIRQPFEERQRERLMPRPLAIAVAYIIVFSILGIAIAWLTPLVNEQAKELTTNLPTYTNSIRAWFGDISTRFKRYSIPEAVQVQINEKASGLAADIGTQVTNFLIALATYLPWLILVPVLGFFFLKDANFFRISFLRLFPSGRWRARIESVIYDVNQTLAAYTRAQLISCVLIGAICTTGFYLIGINYALLLGIVAGVLEFIPLLGPLTVFIVATTAAGLQSPWQALYTAIFLGALRIIHDYFTYPRIVRGGIHLHPLAIILSVLAGEQVAGIPGVFISIPVVA
ncbi:MAG TPA: AI-2E family transporter, partial [Pyrinomonadaceae bacterium]|nr:AI-2E family transporter [Pyrinomonadaceae bacterium]